MVLVTLATTRPREAKETGADGDKEQKSRNEIAEVRDVKNEASEEQFDDDGGQSENIVGDDAGGEHVAGGDRRHVEAAQDALFAERDQSGAEPPEAAHDGEGDDRTEQIATRRRDHLWRKCRRRGRKSRRA